MGLKLMCVTAHPDDECFGFGGALALAADRGIETYVVCLTDGQAASNRGNAASGAVLGAIRREEFRRSCEVLGVTQHELMDYHDGRLEFVEERLWRGNSRRSFAEAPVPVFRDRVSGKSLVARSLLGFVRQRN